MFTMEPDTSAFIMACAVCLMAKAVPLTFVPKTRSQSEQADQLRSWAPVTAAPTMQVPC